MSKCPYCGSNKVSRTFNFNEYTCDICECDYKHTSDGIRIFQEGSWTSFCNSIIEDVSSKASAPVVDLVSKTMRGYAKRDASEIDLVIESLSSIASTLNTEMKAGLRGKNDFLIVMEQIDTAIRAAHSLYKRQEDLGIRVKLSESVLDWFKGEEESETVNNTDKTDIQREDIISDLDIITDETIENLGNDATKDEAVISYIQKNHPDAVENLNIILQVVHDKLEGESIEKGNGIKDYTSDFHTFNHSKNVKDKEYDFSGDKEYDESDNKNVLDELVPIYKLDKIDDLNAKPDLGIEPEDEADENEVDVEVKEDENSFASDVDSKEEVTPNKDEDESEEKDTFAKDTEDESDNDESDKDDDVIADIQDAAETVQDKFKRLEGKIDDLLNKVQILTGDESSKVSDESDENNEESTGEEDPFANEDSDEGSDEGSDEEFSDEGEQSVDNEEDDTGSDKGEDTDSEDPFAEAIVSEAAKRKAKKIGVITTRDNTKASYQRKQSSIEAHKETEEDGEDRSDMKADVQEEDIPYTEGPKKQMDKDTESNAPGATKKPTGKVAYREGFNGFRVDDEVILEGSSDTWRIIEINKNIFTLKRGKTTTKIDIFKESIRHIDSRLEWQAINELMGESKNTWNKVAMNYVTDKEEKVTGVIGLGGGNRIGGQKFGSNEVLSEATKIPVIETSATDRKEIYKYIKDNSLHRLAREVAIQRTCERFTNPIEEINNIVDDAILSDDAAQVESIDSQYEYKAAPIGEHALRQAFQRGWQTVVETESKEAKPSPKKAIKENRGVGYYRTEEDKIINELGRTAADRLMGK